MFLGGNIHVGNMSIVSGLAYIPVLDDYTFLAQLEAENASRHVVTANGNAALDGGGACTFDGTGDYLSVPDSDDWDQGTADFTIEAKVKVSTLNTRFTLWSCISNPNGYALQIYNSGGWYLQLNDSWTTAVYVSWTPSINTDYDIAVVKNGSNILFFVDGAQQGASQTAATTYNSNAALAVIGSDPDFTNDMAGKIGGIRITKSALYTGTYTPPTSFTSITNTVLALNFAGTATSTRIIDSALPANGGAVGILPDVSGNEEDAPQATAASQPVYNSLTGALEFDGIDDYLANALTNWPQPFTLYLAADVTLGIGLQTLMGSDATWGGFSTSNPYMVSDGGISNLPVPESGGKSVYAFTFDGASSGMYINGVQVMFASSVGTAALLAFGLGATESGANPTEMDLYGAYPQAGTFDATLSSTIATKYSI